MKELGIWPFSERDNERDDKDEEGGNRDGGEERDNVLRHLSERIKVLPVKVAVPPRDTILTTAHLPSWVSIAIWRSSYCNLLFSTFVKVAIVIRSANVPLRSQSGAHVSTAAHPYTSSCKLLGNLIPFF